MQVRRRCNVADKTEVKAFLNRASVRYSNLHALAGNDWAFTTDENARAVAGRLTSLGATQVACGFTTVSFHYEPQSHG